MERTSGGHLLQPPLLKQLPRMKCSSCTATSQKLKEKKKQEGAQTLLTHNRLTFLQVQQQQTHGQVRIKQEFTMLFTKRKKSKHSWQKKKKKGAWEVRHPIAVQKKEATFLKSRMDLIILKVFCNLNDSIINYSKSNIFKYGFGESGFSMNSPVRSSLSNCMQK